MIFYIRWDYNNFPGEMVVQDGVDDVPDDAEDVETREDWLGEVDVLGEGH